MGLSVSIRDGYILFTFVDDKLSEIFITDKCRQQNFLSTTCQSKHAELARVRRMGVAYLSNARSDWSIVRECRPTIRRNIGGNFSNVFTMSANVNRCDGGLRVKGQLSETRCRRCEISRKSCDLDPWPFCRDTALSVRLAKGNISVDFKFPTCTLPSLITKWIFLTLLTYVCRICKSKRQYMSNKTLTQT